MSHVTEYPLVSVIIPAFNPGRFIVEALESVDAQQYPNIEIIVVDDASTDETPNILESMSDHVRHIRQDRAGASVARNRGILASAGEYVAFLDADDIWHPEKLEIQYVFMRDNPDVVLSGHPCPVFKNSFLEIPSSAETKIKA